MIAGVAGLTCILDSPDRRPEPDAVWGKVGADGEFKLKGKGERPNRTSGFTDGVSKGDRRIATGTGRERGDSSSPEAKPEPPALKGIHPSECLRSDRGEDEAWLPPSSLESYRLAGNGSPAAAAGSETETGAAGRLASIRTSAGAEIPWLVMARQDTVTTSPSILT